MKTCYTLLAFLLALLLGTGCDSSSRKGSPPEPAPSRERAKEVFSILVKDATAYVELAYTEEDRTRGLMYRQNLSQDGGMLFIFPREEVRHFWMKNTTIPLSTAFITADGYIVKIVDMAPQNNVPDWQLRDYSSDIPAKYVLEMEYGWFEKHGIKRGDRVFFPESVLSVVPEEE